MINRKLAGVKDFAAVLAFITVAGVDITAVEFHLASRQVIIEQEAYNSWNGDIKINRRDPVVGFRLKLPLELTDLAPAFKIIVGVSAFFAAYDFGKLACQQGKCPPCADNTKGHIVLVEDKNIAIKSRLI